MPFTLCHPAIVLPLNKLKVPHMPLSALIIGSMIPDFEYFIKMKLSGRFGHTYSGLLMFDLPMAFGVMLVFHWIVKRPVIQNLPAYWQLRYQDLYAFDFFAYLRRYPHWLLLALLLGSFSHLLWDSFTHANTLPTRHLLFLRKGYVIANEVFPLFRILQHVSTLVGGVVILHFIHRRPRLGVQHPVSWGFWIAILVVTGAIVFLRGLAGFEYVGDIVATIISAACLALIVVSLAVRKRYG